MVVGTPALSGASTSKPCACSSSSWSLVTTSSSVDPIGRSTCAGAGVTVVPVIVTARRLTLPVDATPGVPPGPACGAAEEQAPAPARTRTHTAYGRARNARMAPILGRAVWQSVTMSDRLTSLDASFLYLEESTTSMHVGSVMVFQPPRQGFDYDQLVRIIESRIGAIPRFRQKVLDVPGRIANPVWVDDEAFDMGYHVRRAGLPRPGSDRQLQDFVARVQPRKLDRTRPLWEVYLVEGLHDGRFAVVTKTHHALIDGVNALDIAHVIVDAVKGEDLAVDPVPWDPHRAPSSVELVTEAVVDV